MTNDERARRQAVIHRVWLTTVDIGNAMFYGPISWMLALIFMSSPGRQHWLPLLPLTWTLFYVVIAPAVVWLAYYDEMMPVGRSVTALSVGAAPGLLFLIGGPIAEKPLIWLTLPALLAWGVAGHYFTFHRLPKANRARTVVVTLAMLGCLAGIGGSAIGLVVFHPSGNDPPMAQMITWAISAVCIASALLLGLQCRRLARIFTANG